MYQALTFMADQLINKTGKEHLGSSSDCQMLFLLSFRIF